MADFSTPLPQAIPGAAATSSGDAKGFVEYLKSFLVKDLWVEKITQISSLSKSFFNPLEFSRPTSQTDWIGRVSTNGSRFAPIYVCFFLPILIHSMMSTLWLRVGSLVLLALWLYAYGYKKDESVLIIAGVPAPKVIACSVVSIVVMLATGMLNALMGAMFLFALVGMPHMSLHNAPTSDAMDAVELQAIAVPGM